METSPIEQLLEEKNFIVRVTQDKNSDNFFAVEYPALSLYVTDSQDETAFYQIEDCHVIYSQVDDDIEDIYICNYLRKLFVLADIYRTCIQKSINPELVIFYNAEGRKVKDFWELTKHIKITDKGAAKEKFLRKVAYELITNKKLSQEIQDEIVKQNLVRSVSLLKGFLV